MTTLGLGLIGCGGMGRALASAARNVPGACVVAVADPLEQPRREAAEQFEAQGYDDYHDLLARADIGGVLVAPPNYLHEEVTVAAAQAGKHIFCEKPMALNVTDCDAMIRAARAAGVKLMVGQVLRLMFPFARIKELAADGELGPPACVDITRIGPWGFREHWRTKRALSGGPLFEVNVHELDLMRHLCGEVEQVSAYGGRFLSPHVDFYDVYLVNMRFRSGAVGRLRAGCAGPVGKYEGEVICPGGTLTWGPGWSTAKLYRQGAEPEELTADEWTRPGGVDWEIGSFVAWVLRDEPPVLTAHDGRAAVELAQAAYLSIERGQPVNLPLEA